MTKRNLRIAFRLTPSDMDKFEALQTHFGDSAAGTFRTLLTVKIDQEKLQKRAEKTADEMAALNSKIDALTDWLKQRVE